MKTHMWYLQGGVLLVILQGMLYGRSFILCALCLPSFVFADAGFAKSSLWLSRADIVEGETATLYASLSNTGAKLDGTVVFSENSMEFGRVTVSLAQGEGRIVSVSWKPKENGTYSLKAALAGTSGETIDELSIAIFVKEKPSSESEAQVAATIEGSEAIQQTIAEYAPQVSGITNPIFEKIDSLRQGSALFLDGQITEAQKSLNDVKVKKDAIAKEKVLGTETSPETKSENRKLTISYLLQTLLLYTLSVIRFAVSQAALFYPLFAIVVLGGLWKGFQRIRNPVRYADNI